MTKVVPYLAEEAIERDAESLLSEFADACDIFIEPPIPIEDIVEKRQKLGIEFDDTHRLFGVPRDSKGDADILGAIFFDEGRIVIDESLDPEENPSKEGRYRYTLAHEDIGVFIATCCLPRARSGRTKPVTATWRLPTRKQL